MGRTPTCRPGRGSALNVPSSEPIAPEDVQLFTPYDGQLVGRVTLPDDNLGTLVQPAGREWRAFRIQGLFWITVAAIALTLTGLLAFYLWRGPIRIERGRAGRWVPRFGSVERFTHWATALSFISLGLTGLVITFGRYGLIPLIGHGPYSSLAWGAKHLHNWSAPVFVLGIALMLVLWIRDNIPSRADLTWIRAGRRHVPPRRARLVPPRDRALQRGPEDDLLGGGAGRRRAVGDGLPAHGALLLHGRGRHAGPPRGPRAPGRGADRGDLRPHLPGLGGHGGAPSTPWAAARWTRTGQSSTTAAGTTPRCGTAAARPPPTRADRSRPSSHGRGREGPACVPWPRASVLDGLLGGPTEPPVHGIVVADPDAVGGVRFCGALTQPPIAEGAHRHHRNERTLPPPETPSRAILLMMHEGAAGPYPTQHSGVRPRGQSLRDKRAPCAPHRAGKRQPRPRADA